MRIYSISQTLPVDKREDLLLETQEQEYRIRVGLKYWFEYHCYEGHDSADANLWYHSHQPVTVLSMEERGSGRDEKERGENGHPAAYKVRFQDGLIGAVVEDELCLSKDEFFRPDPPKQPF